MGKDPVTKSDYTRMLGEANQACRKLQDQLETTQRALKEEREARQREFEHSARKQRELTDQLAQSKQELFQMRASLAKLLVGASPTGDSRVWYTLSPMPGHW
jgi:uncharacterized membrane-anchored protein YhcB (DUF1043 family)